MLKSGLLKIKWKLINLLLSAEDKGIITNSIKSCWNKLYEENKIKTYSYSIGIEEEMAELLNLLKLIK